MIEAHGKTQKTRVVCLSGQRLPQPDGRGFCARLWLGCHATGQRGSISATALAPDTIRAMLEKNIDLRQHFPKSIRHLGRVQWDVVVNMSETFVYEDTV